MNLDEAALLARLQAGDNDAFEACVRTYCGQMLRVAWRILRNEEDASDAVQPAPRPPGAPLPARPAFSARRRMNCREFTEFLHEYLFGNLPDGERAEFDKHLAECPWCVAYLDSYQKTIRLGQTALSAAEDAPP
jgi:hypothetical protein